MTDAQIGHLRKGLAAGLKLYYREPYEQTLSPISHITDNHLSYEGDIVPETVAWLAGKMNQCITLYGTKIEDFTFIVEVPWPENLLNTH